MAREQHQARQFPSPLAGVEAVALVSGRTFPRHAHDEFGIGFIAAGAHRSWSGLGFVEAGPGDVITVNPGEMHDGSPVGAGPRSWRMLYVDPALLQGLWAEEASGPVEIARPVLRDTVLAARLAGLFGAFEAGPDPLRSEGAVVATLAHLLGRHGSRRPARTGAPPNVARAMRRLEEAPARPATLAELAALAGCSRFQLLRGFARAVGITPHAFLLQQRVRLARRLLKTGCRPAEAAAAAGFADQSHLTRAFRRQFGLTPARYARMAT